MTDIVSRLLVTRSVVTVDLWLFVLVLFWANLTETIANRLAITAKIPNQVTGLRLQSLGKLKLFNMNGVHNRSNPSLNMPKIKPVATMVSKTELFLIRWRPSTKVSFILPKDSLLDTGMG